jgi:RecB family exonuclease
VWPAGALRLSATQLDTYADCPLRYAYRYGVGARDEGSLYADLGSRVHDVLERFLDPAAGEPRTSERLFEIADECWRDDIARYRPQLEEARRDYLDMLAQWWEKEGGLSGLAPEVLATEHPFSITVGDHTVEGRIDRVDRADDGTGIRVVDYKTGKAIPHQDTMADDLQLATYHLAATRDPVLSALGPPTQLRLLYLRRMEAREQEVRPDHAETTEARIFATAERILTEEFEPSAAADCDHCDFHRLCPLWPEGREVGET